MNRKQFLIARYSLGKSQAQIARLLGISAKAVQSFEQGWRNIPVHTERQLLLLLALKQKTYENVEPCWILRRCPTEARDNCPAWEFKLDHFCWFINGTICHGKVQTNWRKKMKMCRQCEVFRKSVSL